MEVLKEKMSHKQQAELKLKIQSEKQRMEREQEIHVPYHKPKQYTLKEFLARKSINMPTIEKIMQGERPVDSIIALKMRGEELEKFAQKMKEREEEALEFFRSESESDDGDDDDSKSKEKENDIENIASDINVIASSNEAPEKQVEGGAADLPEENSILDKNEISDVIADDVANIPEPSPEPNESKDAELDRLREKYKNEPIEIEDKPTQRFSTLKTLREMNPSDVIDLESGLIKPRELSGPEKLFQRYLKTVQKPKHKDSVSMHILTVENGKLENQKVEVKLEKETELDHNRPGFSRQKLKDDLMNQILDKRREEIKSKLVKVKPIEFEPEDKSAEGLDQHEAVDELSDEEENEIEEENDIEDCSEEEETELCNKKRKSKGAGCSFLDEQVRKSKA